MFMMFDDSVQDNYYHLIVNNNKFYYNYDFF